MHRSLGLLAALALSTLAAGAAASGSLPNYNATCDPATSPAPSPRRGALEAPGIAVSSVDPRRGVPTFVWATRGPGAPPPITATDPARVARAYLDRYAGLYGLSPEALATARVTRVHDTGRGGIVVVLRQAPGGIELFQHDQKVLLDRKLGLVAISGSLHPAARADIAASPKLFHLSAADALGHAFEDLAGIAVPASSFTNERRAPGDYLTYELSPGPALLAAKMALSRPARVKKVFFPLPDRIVAAYYLEILAGPIDATDAEGHAFVIDARTGRLLYRADLVQSEVYKYRVWSEQSGNKRPLDGPIADFTPSPSGVPDDTLPPFIPPVLVSMDGFNHNPDKKADSWLFPGATETAGNNVDAYTDHAAPDGYSNGDLRATTTSDHTFDRVYDVTKEPLDSPAQSMAAVTQLFFTTNWMHDYWYDSGFDEAAGNAQRYNGGRGGLEGDELHAEAQDGALEGNLDNANMYTPADGDSPRMQMYIWSGLESRSVVLTPGGSIASAGSDFGPGSFQLSGEVALVDDGTAPTADACQPIVNDVSGKIALLHRGTCTFKQKVVYAQQAGAIGVLLANNQPGAPPFPAGDDPEIATKVTIPVIPITMADGAAIEAALGSGPVSVAASRSQGVHPDGTIDSPVIAHEWGHYLHHRLVDCNTLQCDGQSEGWGDFLAMTLMVRPEDDLHGAYASTIYAVMASQNAVYFGLRRVPYSVDFSKNDFTFKHIADGEPLPDDIPLLEIGGPNSEVHNTGEIWTQMLFEGYIGLLDRTKQPDAPYSFEQARRRMADYVVAGMSLTPPQPTFNEQRDALLAAAFAADPDDMLVLAKGFAKRGLGSCSVSPPKDTADNTGLTESFELAPSLHIADITLDDGALSCDSDGHLDAGEKGKLSVTLQNGGIVPLTGAKLTLAGAAPGLTIDSPTEVDVPAIAPLSSTKITFDLSLGEASPPASPVTFTVSAKAEGACAPMVERTIAARLDYDNAAGASATDSFDSDISVWTPGGDAASAVWSRAEAAPLDLVWSGRDLDGYSDTWLTSPPLPVSSTEPLSITLTHRYRFEMGPETEGGPDIAWDGGVIEISTNDGKLWKDIDLYGEPAYSGSVTDQGGNVLANRKAYVGQSPSWPMTDEVTIDLGKKLAGQTVLLRFRIGSDEAVGAEGWEIHAVSVKGLTSTPFPVVTGDQKICNRPPVAVASPGQTVKPGEIVLLDASKSHDPDGDPLTFSWAQTAGPAAPLSQAGSKAIFTAPAGSADLAFQVTVGDGKLVATDSVSIAVRADGAPSADDLVARGGCSCEASAARETPGLLPLLLSSAAPLARRRRRFLATRA
ncbi:MAG: M36 family metallopeptidase [Byssovorax sp.]